ncbi:HutD family protein [Arthrobacter sp. A2-55]|uniref:HutD/Ves family protein n=1 Tax=Arthrobacter sp. A2-55 TaxID=2897337 RepID=UPI0021CDC9C0|nr:HutD family protein [Arthrobacter sp. A2-55]MCU6479582.1 HutD family protein [Arthrobacter sp. A2-55]
MGIIRYAALKAAPWANGGGVTRQVAAGPDPANWDWRISIAEVAKAGAFSAFPGMERIITIIDGELIALTVDGAERAVEKFRPFRFSGDSDTSATLPTGALKDLNLITRRGAFAGHATILELSKKRPHPVFAGQYAVLLQGSATVSPADEALARFDTVVGSDDAPEISGRGFLAVLSIDPA